MTAALLIFWAAAAPAQAGEGATFRIRLTTGAEFDAVVLRDKATPEGLVVLRRGPVEAYEVFYRWEQLAPDIARNIRAYVFGAEAATAVPEGAPAPAVTTIPGVIVHLRDGSILRGVRTHLDDAAAVVLQIGGRYERVPRERIEAIENAEIPLHVAFSPDQIVEMVTQRVRPTTPEEFDRLAQILVDEGLSDRAYAMVRIGRALREAAQPEHHLYRSLMRIHEALREAALQAQVYRVATESIEGRYEEALERIRDLSDRLGEAAADPFVAEELRRIRAELVVLRNLSLEARIVAEYEAAAEAYLHLRALDAQAGLGDSVRWAREELPALAAREAASRLGYTPGDPTIADTWARRPPERRLIHAYEDASWIVERLEAPEARAWWGAADPAARRRLLKGLYIEANLTVVAVDHPNCPRCGATGQITGPGGRPAECPQCRGTHRLRVLVYR